LVDSVTGPEPAEGLCFSDEVEILFEVVQLRLGLDVADVRNLVLEPLIDLSFLLTGSIAFLCVDLLVAWRHFQLQAFIVNTI